ncbi:hypothetical protein ZWY2020_056552 [Hordeum vulgare]|nr:hypothetical protein ZWY2020_056552 [Hordeum vulgare]
MEPFEVPDFPVRAIGKTATFRGFFQHPGGEKEQRNVLDADGLLLNTFRGVEGIFVDAYGRAQEDGPSPTRLRDLGQRRRRHGYDVAHAVSWLDARHSRPCCTSTAASLLPPASPKLALYRRAGRLVVGHQRAKTDLAVKAPLNDEGSSRAAEAGPRAGGRQR